jgi:hypothetical protein
VYAEILLGSVRGAIAARLGEGFEELLAFVPDALCRMVASPDGTLVPLAHRQSPAGAERLSTKKQSNAVKGLKAE